MTYLLSFVMCFLAGWSVAASEQLFRREDRPGIFHGTGGTWLLLAATAACGLLAAGGVLWSFAAIPSSAVMIVIAGGGYLGFAASNRLHVNVSGAVNRFLVGLAGLTLVYGFTRWAFPTG